MVSRRLSVADVAIVCAVRPFLVNGGVVPDSVLRKAFYNATLTSLSQLTSLTTCTDLADVVATVIESWPEVVGEFDKHNSGVPLEGPKAFPMGHWAIWNVSFGYVCSRDLVGTPPSHRNALASPRPAPPRRTCQTSSQLSPLTSWCWQRILTLTLRKKHPCCGSCARCSSSPHKLLHLTLPTDSQPPHGIIRPWRHRCHLAGSSQRRRQQSS